MPHACLVIPIDAGCTSPSGCHVLHRCWSRLLFLLPSTMLSCTSLVVAEMRRRHRLGPRWAREKPGLSKKKSDDGKRRALSPSLHAGSQSCPHPHTNMLERYPSTLLRAPPTLRMVSSHACHRPISIQPALPEIVTRRAPPPACSPPAKIRTHSLSLPCQRCCCNVSEKANPVSISTAALHYWPADRPAHRPQTAVPDMGPGCRETPLAGGTSHRPFRRHNHAGASLTDAVQLRAPCFARKP
jgi:hypothetical protein